MNNIETLKSNLRIEKVAAHYATLHKSGSNYKMLCPFHDDNHPSLVIHTGRQFFKCHACGEGGDVFKLVQQFEHCSFKEALDKLGADSQGKVIAAAVETGLALSPSFNACENEYCGSVRPTDRASPVSTTDAANKEFIRMLLPYASGDTELSQAYIDFEVGLAPHLLPPKWKVFAGRIIFPIRDDNGYLVGFGGRLTQAVNSQQPKYINSSADSGFRKGNVLYGLFRAKDTIKENGRVFVVEGYRDVMAMHAAGYSETVGLCGTALADGQAELLKSLNADIILVLDGDGAGRKAAGHNMALLQAKGLETSVVYLTEGEDPDSLFRQMGKDKFRMWIEIILRPADITEEWLVTLLLMFPQAILRVKGEYYDFPSLLDSLLVTDNIPFVSLDHSRLLDLLMDEYEQRQAGEVFTTGLVLEDIEDEGLREVAITLYARHNQLITHLAIQSGLEVIDNDKDMDKFTDFIIFFIHEYYESRLYAQIRAITKSLNRHPVKDGEYTLLAELDERREMLASVSQRLDRTGAVVN